MSVHAVRWEGTIQSWHAVIEFYDGLEGVAIWDPYNNTLDAGTTGGRKHVPIGWWLLRRDRDIELRPPNETLPSH